MHKKHTGFYCFVVIVFVSVLVRLYDPLDYIPHGKFTGTTLTHLPTSVAYTCVSELG